MDILSRIKEHLKKDGRNMRWLAHKFDVSDNHVRMVLRGERPLSKTNLDIVKEIWPDIEYSDIPQKDKPLFKDEE
jgi:lambda repressor-like predicted transcriptional regulator